MSKKSLSPLPQGTSTAPPPRGGLDAEKIWNSAELRPSSIPGTAAIAEAVAATIGGGAPEAPPPSPPAGAGHSPALAGRLAESAPPPDAPRQGRHVCILGFAQTNRHLAPVGDPNIEIWTMNEHYTFLDSSQVARWFELHSDWLFEWQFRRPAGHVERLRAFGEAGKPVVLIEQRPDIPNSVRYPLEAVVERFGLAYFTSTPAYMLAMALMEGVERVSIYGIELMTATEYAAQRPCFEFWIGLARGMGVEVSIPQGCQLLTGPLYGRPRPDGESFTRAQFEQRLKELETLRNKLDQQHQELIAQMHILQGGVMETRYWRDNTVGGAPKAKYEAHVTKIEERQKLIQGQIDKVAAQLKVTEGCILECRYWIGMTPEGPAGEMAEAELLGRELPFKAPNGQVDVQLIEGMVLANAVA